MTAGLALGALALLTALAISVPIAGITEADLLHARDLVLLGLLAAAGAACVVAGEAWLGALAASFVVRWRSRQALPSLVCWLAIAGAWLGATSLVAFAR